VSGGAALSVDTELGFNELGLKLIQGYGLTETAPVLTLNPLNRPKPGSIGVPFPDVQIKIFEPNEEGVGEIIAKGPNIMQGYYKNPEATAEVLRDGWLHTGDLGRIFIQRGRRPHAAGAQGGWGKQTALVADRFPSGATQNCTGR